MNGMYGFADSEAYDESFDEAYDEAYDEAAPPRRTPLRPISPPRQTSAYRPKATPATSSTSVSQAQFKAALDRVSQQINTNAGAIKAVDGRVRHVASDHSRLSATVRKEISSVRKDLQSTREISAILPLITSLGGANNPIAAFAPLLLLGGDVSGDSSSSNNSNSSGLGGLGGSTGLIMILALSGALAPKTA